MTRMFGLRDILWLEQLQAQGVAFDLRRLLLYRPCPVRAAIVGYLTGHHVGAVTCVCRPAVDIVGRGGFVQIWPRADEAEWELVFLAPSLEYQGSDEVWLRLLADMVVLGAERGMQRIYARCAEDAETEDILRQVGFTIINREEVFVCACAASPAPQPRGLRQVTPQDQAALDALYAQTVPQLVQQAEGFTPHWWAAHHDMRPIVAQEYLWIEKGQSLAYLGLCSSARGYWLEIVVRPEHRAEVLPHVKYLLTLARASATTPLYCPVPDYSVGLGWLLRTLGFEPYTRQVLTVVHPLARVPVRHPMLVAGLERRVDVSTTVGRMFQGKS